MPPEAPFPTSLPTSAYTACKGHTINVTNSCFGKELSFCLVFFYKKRLLDVGRTLPHIKHYQTVKPYMPRNHFLGPRNSAATRCSAERCGNHATPGSKRLGWLCQGFKMNSMVQRCVYIYIYIYFNIYIYIHITVIIETHPYLVGGWALPLWKIWKSVGMIIPNWMEK